ncbi:N-acetyltransferase [Pseudomonas sp. Irchel s3h14]|uniref:N-acetyltransferase n=1 Tax=Pseudomonas sp. Irchel s3h14 TaxID=2009179 RepID=UPI000BA2FADE|nr:N-acetyltransferase [Pseudomonas sp. Irchel s3h14]
MRRKGKGTDLRNQTFKSDARKLTYKAFIKKVAPRTLKIDVSAVRFEPITATAIEKCHLWEGAAIYAWDHIPDWKRKDAKGLDLAIWYEQNLCGLCYATPRRSAICLKVILLQGDPDKSHPLRGLIAPIAILAADFYARMLGCREIEIQDPDPNVVFYYLELGFEFDQTNRLVIYLSGQ